MMWLKTVKKNKECILSHTHTIRENGVLTIHLEHDFDFSDDIFASFLASDAKYWGKS